MYHSNAYLLEPGLLLGLVQRKTWNLREGDLADLVAFGTANGTPNIGFRQRRTTASLVYDACHERMTVFGGGVVSRLR
jgi:hypothetical protein